MRLSRWISSLGLLSVLTLSDGCAPARDWTSPEYISVRLKEGDERAFAELTRLTPEQQKALVPVLIEAYNAGKKPQRAIEALASIGDPAAKEAFGAALTQSDDMLAGLAARGLGNIGDKGSAASIAKRLGEVTTDEAYPAFFEALSKLPIDAAADALSAVLMRPAAKIGGAGSVRLGCRALAEASAPTDVILDALVFGLVNFVPAPFKDPMPDCELAILKMKDAGIPKLVELFEGKNVKVNDHLKGISYPAVTGQLRAAAVLAHSQNPAAIKAITQFVSTPHPIPTAELAAMAVADQQNFYANSGQMFDQAAKALGAAGGPENLATLRKLENAGAGSFLANFSEWFSLSDGAEVGLRQSVHEGLAVIGDASDRKLLWDRATAGAVGRGGDNTAGLLRTNALHYLGRTARPGERANFAKVLAAQTKFKSSFAPDEVYFLLADKCQDDVACYTAAFKDPAATLQDPAFASVLSGIEEAKKASFMSTATSNIRAAGIWQLAIRLGANEAAISALLDNLNIDNMEARSEIAATLLFVDKFPADAKTKMEASIAADTTAANAPGLKETRHGYRLIVATRL